MIVFQFRIIKSVHPEPSMIKFSNIPKGPPRFRPVIGGLVGFDLDFIHSVERKDDPKLLSCLIIIITVLLGMEGIQRIKEIFI